MDLAAIVVNWNTRDHLARCLHALQAALAGGGLACRVVVVDSASADGSAEMVRQEYPGLALLELPENRGFGAAANAGLALSGFSPSPAKAEGQGVPAAGGQGERARAALVLNADTEVEGTAIPDMLTYLDAHPDVGVVGPQLRFPDGTVQPSRRRFPTPGTLFWESTVLEQYFPRNRWVRRYRCADRPDDVEQEVDWLVGACLLVRGEAIAQAGLLDEGYFLYFEELEWCRRIRQAGWGVVYLPSAHVVHHEGRSSAQVPLQRHLYFERSRLRYARETFGPRTAAVLRHFLLDTYLWLLLVEGSKWVLGHKRELRRERMRIYAALLRDGLRDRPPVSRAAEGLKRGA